MGYEAAMEKVRALGGDTYGYAAGQGSIIMFNAMLASTEEGRELFGVRNDTGDNRI